MLAGELYDCGDQELIERWHKAKNLVREYNRINSENLAEKGILILKYVKVTAFVKNGI